MKNSLNLEQLNLCTLKETRDWYLEDLKPLVDEKSFKKATDNIDKFIEAEGIKLQEKLEKYKKDIYPESWLMPYSKDIYLYGRGPVTIAGNYLLETIPYQEDIDYLNFVTRIVLSIQDLYQDLVNKEIPQMKAKDQLLCMKQLKGFLRGTRAFNLHHDDYKIYEDYKEVNSCAIFYKNNCYIVKLFDENGTKVASDILYQQIKAIYKNTTQVDLSFTCLAFNDHDDSYNILLENEENQKELDKVNKAICGISLNDKKGSKVSTNQKNYYDATNVWPLKSWSIEIFQDLVCTFNNEHTFVDGSTSSNLVGDLFDKVNQHHEIFDLDSNIDLPEQVILNLDQDKLASIKKSYVEYANQFDSKRFEFNDLDITGIRENKINVDALFQLGFLYANYFAFDELKTIHESVSVAQYYDGRTSMLRSASCEGLDFIKELANSNNQNEILNLLKDASNKHIEKVKKAKDICSIERHYAGLDLFVENEGLSFFQDPGFIKHSTQEICTSSMGNTKLINRFAYAPVAQSGLGIGYLSQGSKFIADVSYYKKDEKDVIIFVNKLQEYYEKINNLFKKDL